MVTITLHIDKDSAEYRSTVAFLHALKIPFEQSPVLLQTDVGGSAPSYREDWSPDWKGDPDDELRWKGW